MSNDKQAVVRTKAGRVEGSYQDDLYVFKGVPYAAPPVGGLRWLPPQLLEPWRGVRPAKKFGTIAPQNPMAGGSMAGFGQVEPQDEDCLFLNIWTPGLDNARRPVMFWIHGGAFTIGSGSSPMYDRGILAARGDIVLVTINYRLGMLGFLRLKDVTGGKIPATGNEGLMDQIAALEWVRDNIAAFGGDPRNITVFGESAGGMSIGCLMAMPSARGRFHKAILESGVGNTSVSLSEANNVAGRFLEVVGIESGDIKALRALTVAQLLDVEMKLRVATVRPGEAARITATAPVIDGQVIPGVTNEIARQGSAREVPVIIGNNLEEWKLFAMMQPDISKIDEAGLMRRLGIFMTTENARALIAAYRKAREKRGAATNPVELLSAIQTDLMFRVPALDLVEAQRDNGQLAYNYIFTWKSPVLGGVLGACHALEIGFVFGTHDDMFCGSGPDADKLSRCIQDAWLAFARTGDPSCESIGKWPPYGKNRMTMMLGKDCHVEEAPYEDERRAWNKVEHISAMP